MVEVEDILLGAGLIASLACHVCVYVPLGTLAVGGVVVVVVGCGGGWLVCG